MLGGSESELATPEEERGRLKLAFSALEIPVFRWWFFAQTLSGSGTTTQGIALSWLVLRLSGNGIALGGVTACVFGPILFGGAWAGSLVDRVDRRRILIVTQLSFIAISSTLGVVTLLGAARLWMVFVGALLGGCVNALDQPARMIYVIELVGHDRTANAISLNEVVINLSRVVGPAVGGALLATSGVSGCFLFNAATFIPPLLVLLRFPPAEHMTRAPREPGAIRLGFHFAWSMPAIRSTLILAVAGGMLFNLGVTLPLVDTRVFHLGAGSFALMMGAFGAGAIVGATVAAAGSPDPSGRSVRRLALATGLAVLATALSPDVGVELAGLVVCGFFSIWFISRANAVAQLRSPPEMRGRVMGIWTMALPGMSPLSGLANGAVAQEVGAREGFALAGVALVLGSLLTWRALSDRAATARWSDQIHRSRRRSAAPAHPDLG